MNDLALIRYLEYVKEKAKLSEEKKKEIKEISKTFFDFITKEKRGETDWNEQLEDSYVPMLDITASSPEGIRILKDEIIRREILDYLDIFNPELNRRLNSRIKQAFINALTESLIADNQVDKEREDHVRSNIKAHGLVSSFFNFKGKKNKGNEEWTD